MSNQGRKGGTQELKKKVKGKQSQGSMVYIKDCKSKTKCILVLTKIDEINLLMKYRDWNYITICS